MSTFESIIQEVLLNVDGFSRDVNVYGTVATGGITSSASTIPTSGGVFPDGAGFSTGIIEVGDELVYAQSFNRSTGVFSGCLRGWRGTTATSHVAGVLITDNPRFPRSAIKKAINDTIRSVYPRLYAVGSTSFTADGSTVRYALPSTVLNILSVSWEDYSNDAWIPSIYWKFIPNGLSSGKYIEIADAAPGRTVRVVYSKQPTELVNVSDDYSTVTGLEEWTRDIIVYGALWRLVSTIDIGYAGYNNAEQSVVSDKRTSINGIDLTKNFMQLYEARLSEAEERLQELYPAVKHRVW